MRPHKHLKILEKTAIKKLSKLEKLVEGIISSNSGREADTVLAYVTIETLNTWRNFIRSFYLSCTLSPKTVNGKKITIICSTVTNFHDAIGFAISLCKPRIPFYPGGAWNRRDEPTWHDPNSIIKICTGIGCSNIAEIQSAFSGGVTVFKDLPVFRNFYAHRNKESEKAAMQTALTYSISNILKPSEILLSPPLGKTQVLLIEWINELILIIEYLCYE